MNTPRNTTFAALQREPSPLGPLTLAATANGLAGVWFDDQKHHPGELQLAAPVAVVDAAANAAAGAAAGADAGAFADAASARAAHWLAQAADELQRYFAGQLHRFSVALDPQGTAFQQQVWQALLHIGHGQLSTYGQLAQQLGRPAAARAVGAAVGRNPLGIIVPCHRVVGQDGSLTGYAGGLHRKQALLRLEGALLSSGTVPVAGASQEAAPTRPAPGEQTRFDFGTGAAA